MAETSVGMGDIRTRLAKILSSDLLDYTSRITFPWDLTEELDGSEVGNIFFRHDAADDWDCPLVREALMDLSKLRTAHIHAEDLLTVIKSQIKPERQTSPNFQLLDKTCGLILFLDQAPRILCKNTLNARYTYEFFDILALQLSDYLVQLPIAESPFMPFSWQTAGVTTQHAALRISMLMAPLCHSEDLAVQRLQLAVTEEFRQEYERLTGTHDPHRSTKHKDLTDVYLMAGMLRNGPPRGSQVFMWEFVFWILRYFTSHFAYIESFGRSPFRNVAVGRDDTVHEAEWLQEYGVKWTVKDEKVRKKIKAAHQCNTWDPLEL